MNFPDLFCPDSGLSESTAWGHPTGDRSLVGLVTPGGLVVFQAMARMAHLARLAQMARLL